MVDARALLIIQDLEKWYLPTVAGASETPRRTLTELELIS